MDSGLRNARHTIPKQTKRTLEARKLLDRVDAFLYPDNDTHNSERTPDK